MGRIVKRKRDVEKAADIVRDAGGKIVGRTRLQKIAYLLELSGLGDGFDFEYKHYGPFSEDLAIAVRNAGLLGFVHEEERPTSWDGFYSIFTADGVSENELRDRRNILARTAAAADPVELELAATAAFLASEGKSEPWLEVAKRKPEKSDGRRLRSAKDLYRRLCELDTPIPLPKVDCA